MKKILFIFLLLSSGAFAQSSYTDSLTLEREIHDKQFLEEVLNGAEREELKQVCYFAIDTNYIVEATFIAKRGKRFMMPMSSERIQYYRSIGTLTFEINGVQCSLELYKNLSSTDKTFKNYYFLPFRDGTSGKTSYGGGRYIDLILTKEQLKSGKVIIDFNTCYHPYCAYSKRYSCPIVPVSNRITPKIEAGECYTLGEH